MTNKRKSKTGKAKPSKANLIQANAEPQHSSEPQRLEFSRESRPTSRRSFIGCAVATMATLALLVIFLGPTPAGGDVTLVHLPRMSFYHDALVQGRLPRWNEQADFGTPFLAEGQFGVYYPPHLLLYGLMDTQAAYRASMLLHFVLAAWFAYWCGRGFHLSQLASVLVAIVFVGQGFFVVHLTDPWSYTTGCWLPLAVLAAWRWLDVGAGRWLVASAGILAMQLLAGHFQLAFYTQVVVVLLGVAAPVVMAGRRVVVLRRALLLPAALAGALALAAVQLVPTAELAAWGDVRGRGFDYLASFTMHPLHLVNFLAPTLLHGDPLWEPIAWEPWRASAGECLTYVGVVPLGLAVWAIVGCWVRSQHAGHTAGDDAKIWCVLLAASIALGIGPFLPGFRELAQLPGFGWFSATARWTVVSGLFVSLLAGRGLDQFDPFRGGQWVRAYVGLALPLLVVVVVTIVIAVQGAERFDAPPDRLGGVNLGPKLLSHGYPRDALVWIRPSYQLPWMILSELMYPVVGFGIVLSLSFVPWIMTNGRRFAWAAILLAAVDLSLVAMQLNRLEWLPRQPLDEQSAVLGAIKQHDPHRVAGLANHLPMAISVRSLGCPSIPDMSQYWMKDDRVSANLWPESLPTVPGLPRWGDLGSTLGQSSIPPSLDDLEVMRLTHMPLLVLGVGAGLPPPDSPLRRVNSIADPWLSEQTFGKGILELYPDADQWTLWTFESEVTTARAWAFPVGNPADPGSDPRLARRPPPARRGMLDRAVPAQQVIDTGERVVVTGKVELPSVLVLTDLNYPGWEAVLSQGESQQRVPIESAFGDWRAVRISEPGEYEVAFAFRPNSLRVGTQVSFGALLLWLCCGVITLRWRR